MTLYGQTEGARLRFMLCVSGVERWCHNILLTIVKAAQWMDRLWVCTVL